MMQRQGYRVIEYSNAGSEACPDEHVEMLSLVEYQTLYGDRADTDFHGNDATLGTKGHQLFESRLIPALRERLQPEDIICHPFGHAHQQLMTEFPNHQHVETGIGYPTLMPNSFQIFESYAWMHYHQGKEGRNGKNYEWVVPNYYDLDDWDVRTEHGSYGTPVVSVNYGAMTETVTEGVTGYRCHTLQDWLDGIHAVEDLDRQAIADSARVRWSLETCGARYNKIFCQLNDLYRKGWYEITESTQ